MSLNHLFKSISFIGGGRVTYLLLKGLQNAQSDDMKIIVCDPNQENLSKLENIHSGNLVTSTSDNQMGSADIIILAVHPPVVDEVLSQFLSQINKSSILISLVPTKSVCHISEKLGGFNRIVRMIPNAPSVIGMGYNPVSFSQTISPKEKEDLQALFAAWGDSPEVDEKHLEGYAIITGMGPTYFWFQWLAMQQLAAEFGFDTPASRQAVYSMIKGSNELLFQSGFPAAEVVDLIPVHPLKDKEEQIISIFTDRLNGIFEKLKQATE